MTFEAETLHLAASALAECRARRLTLGTVESCTGGLIAGALTAIGGSSDVVMAGLVTYSNAAKTALAGVPHELIEAHGAVSEPVVRAMAEGGRKRLGVDLCIAVTGIAGPGGGSPLKPVGLVWFAIASAGGTTAWAERFGDIGRENVRARSVNAALSRVNPVLTSPSCG